MEFEGGDSRPRMTKERRSEILLKLKKERESKRKNGQRDEPNQPIPAERTNASAIGTPNKELSIPISPKCEYIEEINPTRKIQGYLYLSNDPISENPPIEYDKENIEEPKPEVLMINKLSSNITPKRISNEKIKFKFDENSKIAQEIRRKYQRPFFNMEAYCFEPLCNADDYIEDIKNNKEKSDNINNSINADYSQEIDDTTKKINYISEIHTPALEFETNPNNFITDTNTSPNSYNNNKFINSSSLTSNTNFDKKSHREIIGIDNNQPVNKQLLMDANNLLYDLKESVSEKELNTDETNVIQTKIDKTQNETKKSKNFSNNLSKKTHERTKSNITPTSTIYEQETSLIKDRSVSELDFSNNEIKTTRNPNLQKSKISMVNRKNRSSANLIKNPNKNYRSRSFIGGRSLLNNSKSNSETNDFEKQKNECTFHPRINHSKAASCYGQPIQILNKIKEKEREKAKRQEEVKRESEYNEMKQCTFQPEIKSFIGLSERAVVKGMGRYMKRQEKKKTMEREKKKREFNAFAFAEKYDKKKDHYTIPQPFKLSKKTDIKECTFHPNDNSKNCLNDYKGGSRFVPMEYQYGIRK